MTTDYEQVCQSQTSAFVIDTISGLRTIKLYGYEVHRGTQLREMLTRVHDGLIGYVCKASLLSLPEAMIGSTIPAVAYGYGGYLVMTGRTTLGAVVASLQYIGRTTSSITSMSGIRVHYQPLVTHAKRIASVLSLETETRIGLTPPGETIRDLVVEELSFRYDEQGDDLLSDISFRIARGEIVSVTGPSGSGKSTLAGLLCGLLRPKSGDIKVNGISLKQLDKKWYRRNVCLVGDDDYLFEGSLLDNLRIACPSATQAELQWCCRASALDEAIDVLPDGWNTQVGVKGAELSSGQKSRLSLARHSYASRAYWFWMRSPPTLTLI